MRLHSCRHLVALVLLLLVLPVSSQVQFSGQIPITRDFGNGSDIALADLNGDGLADMVCCAPSVLLEIQWFENLGGGHWGDKQVVSAGVAGARSLKLADLDGDGDIDVLAGNSSDGRVAWYANDGAGVFGPQQVLATYVEAKHVSVGDVDGDGDIDVIACDTYDDDVYVILNNGGGAFAAPSLVVSYNGGLKSTLVVDLDGDAALDIITCVGSTTNEISWFKGEGNGSFAPSALITSLVDLPEKVIAADFDGDGDLDLASASNTDYKIAWYVNNGGGSFAPQQVLTSSLVWPTGLRASDLDGDGDLDIVACGEDDVPSPTVVWFENTGGGSFGPLKSISSTLLEVDTLQVDDLDGDGDMDILSLSWSQNRVVWFENRAGAVKDLSSPSLLIDSTSVVVGVAAADLDNDGVSDILFADRSNGSSGNIMWSKGTGNGEFDDGAPLVALSWPREVAAGDLNGDGALDIWATHNDGASVYLNAGGVFSASAPIDLLNGGHLKDIFPTDVDLDGDMDAIVSNNQGNNSIFWIENGGLSFTAMHTVMDAPAALAKAFFIDAGDINGDGKPDVVAADGGSNSITVYTNLGTQTWSSYVLSGAFSQLRDIQLGDLDGDGNLDIVALSESEVFWFANQANGASFGAAQNISTAVAVGWSISLSDLNGDGNLDVIVASGNTLGSGSPAQVQNTVEWFENLGLGGSFASARTVSRGRSGVTAVIAADLDGDYDPEVLFASTQTGKVAWVEDRALATHFGGSNADLTLSVAIGGGSLGNWPRRRVVSGGASVLIEYRSPNHTYDSAVPILIMQPYFSSATLVQNTLFPELSLSTYSAAQFPIMIIYDGNQWGGAGMAGALPPNGLQTAAAVPVSLSGINVRIQGLSLAPSSSNPIFTATEGIELRLF